MITRFDLYNSNGQLDASRPFQPFGPLPEIGSFLELRIPQVFHRATLHLEWADLPAGDLSGYIVRLSSAGWSHGAPLFSYTIPVHFENSLRLELIAPKCPFGHLSYPARVMEAALHQSPMPAMPYVPLLKKIWVTT